MKKIIFYLIVFIGLICCSFGASPVINSITISPTIAYTNDTLLGYVNGSDTDGDELSYEWKWYNNNVKINDDNSYGTLEDSNTISYLYRFYNSITNNGTNWLVSNSNSDNIYSFDFNFNFISIFMNTSNEVAINLENIDYHNNSYYVLDSYGDKVIKYNSNGIYTNISYNWTDELNIVSVGMYVDENYVYILRHNISNDYSIIKLYHNLTYSNITIQLLNVPDNIYDLTIVDNLFVVNDFYNIYFYNIDGTYTNISFDVNLKSGEIVKDIYSNSTHIWTITQLGKISKYKYRTTYISNQNNNINNLSSSNFNESDDIILSIRAFDGVSYSDWTNSSLLTISNSNPVFESIRISPTVSYTNNNLIGYSNATDNDNDTLTYYYRWYKYNILNNSGSISGQTQGVETNVNTLSSSYTQKNEEWIFSILISDGTSNTSWYNSTVNTIQNFIPTIDSLSITQSTPNYLDNLTFTNTTTDLDSDTITDYYTKWYKDSIEQISFENQSIISYLNTSVNDNWLVSLNVYDGTNWSGWYNSSSVTIIDNITPVISDISLSASSGENDAEFIIYSNVTDESNLSYVRVQITEPNTIATNFSMTLVANETNKYYKTYIPTTDGSYTFKLFAEDIYSNIQSNISNLTYTESTSAVVVGGGGGGGTIINLNKNDTTKRLCDINISPIVINIYKSNIIYRINITNNDVISFDPSFNIEYNNGSQSLMNNVMLTNTISSILSGGTSSLGIKLNEWIPTYDTAKGTLYITSSKCSEIQIPIIVNTLEIENKTSINNINIFGEDGFAVDNIIKYFLGLRLFYNDGEIDTTAKKFIAFMSSIIGLTFLTFIVVMGFVFSPKRKNYSPKKRNFVIIRKLTVTLITTTIFFAVYWIIALASSIGGVV